MWYVTTTQMYAPQQGMYVRHYQMTKRQTLPEIAAPAPVNRARNLNPRGGDPAEVSRDTPGSERVNPGLHKNANQARATPRSLAGYTRGGCVGVWVGGWVGAMQPLVLPIRQRGRKGHIWK